MANHKSAQKRIRRNARAAEVNRARRGRIRTFLKDVLAAIEGKDAQQAEAAFKKAQPEIMRGVSKGILHKNTAARKMSRLSAHIKGLKEQA